MSKGIVRSKELSLCTIEEIKRELKSKVWLKWKEYRLNILNNKSPIYPNPSTASCSAIGITLSDPSSYMDCTWQVHDDPCDSDHFLIILEITQPIHDNKPPCWKTNKADWQQFKTLFNKRLVLIKHFTKTLIAIANKNIPKTPRFNNKCKIAVMLPSLN